MPDFRYISGCFPSEHWEPSWDAGIFNWDKTLFYCEGIAGWDNRSPAAPYTITNNGTVVATVTVDQTTNGGQFVSLGSFFLEAGTVEVLLNDTPTGYVIADAVKLACQDSGGSVTLTLDNSDFGFSIIGNWGSSSYTSGYYGSNYRYASIDSGSKVATWAFSISQSGNYDVYAQWSSFDNRSWAAPFTIKNNGSTAGTATVDQTQNGGQFVLLGSWYFDAGTVEVILTDTPTGYVIADAVRITKQ